MDKSTAVRGLMPANFIMHFISASLAGVWISDMVSQSGAMTPLAWFETILAVPAMLKSLPSSIFLKSFSLDWS